MTLISHFNGLYAGLWAGSGKNITGHGNIHHAFTDKAADSRLMSGAAQSDDRNAVSIFQFIIDNKIAVFQMDNILIGKRQTFQ